jgi:glycosyltransferase involved in cell wall biosynthesis
MKIGYAPYSPHFDAPGDRRRFCYFAQHRHLDFEIADPRREYDVVVLSAWADITAWSRYPRPAKLVYDIVDSYLSVPRLGVKQVGRGLVKRLAGQTRHLALDYRKAIVQMCRRADAIVCASQEQRSELLPVCPNVHVILDYPGELTLVPKSDYHAGGPFRLVWEGLPYNLEAFRGIASVIQDLSQAHDLSLRIITNREFYAYARRFGKRRSDVILDGLFTDYEFYEWDANLMPTLVRECDLALIPIAMNDPLAVGKSENKLVLLWRLGMPTLTSATPAYVRTMRAAGIDLTCNSPDEWQTKLNKLILEEKARQDVGRTGLTFATTIHSSERILAAWDKVWGSITS